jgi:hypothetical protein
VPPKPANGPSLFNGEEERGDDRGDEKDDRKDDRKPKGSR